MVANEYFFFAGYVVLQFIVLATAWNILGGYAGYVNFGSGAFFAIGAYTTVAVIKAFAAPRDAIRGAPGAATVRGPDRHCRLGSARSVRPVEANPQQPSRVHGTELDTRVDDLRPAHERPRTHGLVVWEVALARHRLRAEREISHVRLARRRDLIGPPARTLVARAREGLVDLARDL